MATVRKGSRRSKEAELMKQRFANQQEVTGEFAKTASAMATRQQKKRADLQKLKKDAYSSNEMAERIANVKKTGGESIDKQIIEQITARGNELAQAHIKAYGPDGSPEMIADYTKQKAQINKDLDDLTVFVGTLDAELEMRDKAIEDGTFIYETNENGQRIALEDDEQFKNGIFNGMSDVELTYDADGGGYSINPTAQHVANTMVGATPADISPINLGQYAENIRKNGTSYQQISPNAEMGMDAYGMNLIGGLAPQMTETITGAITTQPNPDFDPNKSPDPKTNPKEIKAKTGWKSTDINKAKEGLTNALLNQKGFKSFTNAQGQAIKLPPENQLWAQLQNAGYLEDIDISYDLTSQNQGQGKQNPKKTVSWDRYNNPDKEKILKQAYADYLIDTQFQSIDGGDVIEEDKTVQFTGKPPRPGG